MAYARRLFFFVVTNLAVLMMLGLVAQLFGLDRYLYSAGIDYPSLLIFSAIFGFLGSLVSLAMSKFIAKMSVRARVIKQPENDTERWLVETVARLAQDAGIGMPEVAIFPAREPNAFATGARRDAALVAVSAGLLQQMGPKEVEAVLGHEISHVANGDMVTMALLQGVVNTFVFFLSRVIGTLVDSALSRGRDDDGARFGGGPGYFLSVIVSQMFLGLLATMIVMWYSRRREFRADAGSAALRGKQPMIAALQRLGGLPPSSEMPDSLAAFAIRGEGKSGLLRFFRSHPPAEQRIAALQALPLPQ